VVCRALLEAVCGDDATRMTRIDVRFTSPVYPGDAITTDVWKEGDGTASFRARVAERDVLIINNGYAEYR
jgi:acyl dehydratase